MKPVVSIIKPTEGLRYAQVVGYGHRVLVPIDEMKRGGVQTAVRLASEALERLYGPGVDK